jgi:hypothetical protein
MWSALFLIIFPKNFPNNVWSLFASLIWQMLSEVLVVVDEIGKLALSVDHVAGAAD